MLTVMEGIGGLEDAVDGLDRAWARGDTIDALLHISTLATLTADVAALIVEHGAREGKTQAMMARALGVSPRTLAGVRRAVRR